MASNTAPTAQSQRRLRLVMLAGIGLAALLYAGPAHAQDFRDDARTARAVTLSCPRASLHECLRVLSEASEVALSAAPGVGDASLVGYVPRRPLRETMSALAELYDGTWSALPGSPAAYRLEPDAGAAKFRAAAWTAQLKKYVGALDELSAETARDVKAGKPVTRGWRQSLRLAMLLWARLPAAERERVVRGTPAMLSIPPEQAGAVYRTMLDITERTDQPLAGPLMVSFDLDDREDMALPALRTRVSAYRRTSIVCAVSTIDIVRLLPVPKPPPAPESAADAAVLPRDFGGNGRFTGSRDDIVLDVGRACDVPLLSRHRPWGGSADTAEVGGRKVTQVCAQIARACDASLTVNARGYHLLRSLSEAVDPSGVPPGDPVRAYLKSRPAKAQRVRLAQLAALAALTPMQVSVLERSNVCSNEASFVRENHALLRFYRALTQAQQESLHADSGLELSSLPQAQLHALVDEDYKTGDLNLSEALQRLDGLRLRFREDPAKEENSLVLQLLRGTETATTRNVDLPVVGIEEVPSASR